MVFVDRPIEDMLSAIVMCVQHTASILAVFASIFIANMLPYQVCVAEGTDHLELDVPFLLHICGEVTSIG